MEKIPPRQEITSGMSGTLGIASQRNIFKASNEMEVYMRCGTVNCVRVACVTAKSVWYTSLV